MFAKLCVPAQACLQFKEGPHFFNCMKLLPTPQGFYSTVRSDCPKWRLSLLCTKTVEAALAERLGRPMKRPGGNLHVIRT